MSDLKWVRAVAAVCSDITASWWGEMSISSKATESCAGLLWMVLKAEGSRLFPRESDKVVIVATVPFTLSGSVPGSRTQVTADLLQIRAGK